MSALQHRDLAAGRWWELSLAEQLGNIGSEISRASRWTGRNEAGAWALFQFDWDAPAGEHVIRTRATDGQGNSQPDTVPFNEQGYLYNGVVPHPVRVAGG